MIPVIGSLAATLAPEMGMDAATLGIPLYSGLLSGATLAAIVPAYIYIWLVYGV